MPHNTLMNALNSTCCLTLQRNLINYILEYVECSNSFLMHLMADSNEGVIQVIGNKVLEEEFRFTIPHMSDLRSEHSDKQKKEAAEFELEAKLRMIIQPYPNNLLKIPIKHPEEEGLICFLFCVMDPVYKPQKTDGSYSLFVTQCFESCSAIVLNAFNLKEVKHMKDVYQKLISIAKECLLCLGDYNETLKRIVLEARLAIKAERCSLFLLNEEKTELIGKIVEGVSYDNINEITVPINHGIIGFVARNRGIVNIPDAQNHELFYSKIDHLTGFTTRNILCFPVRNESDQIVGVAEMCNKKNGLDFNHYDEQMAAAFGVYFGIALIQGIVHRRIQFNRARERLSLEVISYHLTKDQNEYGRIMNCTENHKFSDMLDYKWLCRQIPRTDSICYVIKMFDLLGISRTWKMSKATLVSFLLSVRSGYRELPYHNWAHAFSVAHFSYFLMFQLELVRKCLITNLEGAVFIISALCHDIDHRGTTNSFQLISNNNLAHLYSSEGSILERHHFSQTLAILNTESCNIFENLTVKQYATALHLMRDLILATDVYQHIQIIPKERNMSIKGYNPAKKRHRLLLLSLMMTCCDLNDQVKGWLFCRDIAAKISTEFFIQGDLEKEMNKTPMEMMDRDRACIPKTQLEFLSNICIPCFSVLANIFPEISMCVRSIEETAEGWRRSLQYLKDNEITECHSIEVIFETNLVNYVMGT